MGINELLKKNRSKILHLTDKYGAKKVRIFGSVARNEARPNSEVDVLVQFESGRSLMDHVALTQDLEDLLGRKVDIVTERSLHWYIRDQVIAEAIPL